jgi:hypothetical protein
MFTKFNLFVEELNGQRGLGGRTRLVGNLLRELKVQGGTQSYQETTGGRFGRLWVLGFGFG